MTSPRWGIYDQGAVWDPVPIEAAYQHQFDLFTHESRLGDSATWRGTGIAKPPGMALARNAICSIGINAYVLVSGVKFPVPSTSGLYNAGFDAVAHGEYDSQVTAWINVLLAFKAEGGQVHALFHLEPSLDNPGQPTAGTSTEYKAAFAHIYPMFNAAGIQLGWDSTSSDWRNGIALDWEPAVYDICSADFYPTSDVTKTMAWGLGDFFAHATSAHPTNPVLVRSTTCKSFTDAQAATWFADASDTMLAVPNLLGVGWDTDNQGLHILDPGETFPAYNTSSLTKTAFYNAAQDWVMTGDVDDDFDRPQPLVDYLIEAHGSTLAFTSGAPPAAVSDDFERDQALVSYLIEAHGSTFEFVTTGAHIGVWDDPLVRWDDPNYTWDGTAVAIPPGPAFEGIGFQSDAFPTSAVNSIAGDQTLPALTQQATGRSSSGIVQIAQTLAALSQSITVDIEVVTAPTTSLPQLVSEALGELEVRADIGDPAAPWQADAFQPDAFRTVSSQGQILPALTQHVIAFRLGAGEAFAESVLPMFTTAVDADVVVASIVANVLPALTQAVDSFQHPSGPIASTLSAFTQSFVAAVQIAPDLAGIHQTLPALQQSFNIVGASWDEWEVTTGREWRVKAHV